MNGVPDAGLITLAEIERGRQHERQQLHADGPGSGMSGEKFVDRPLPSLAAWLGELRAAEFEEWVAENLQLQGALDNPDEQQSARLIKTMSIACVEALRIETERHGADPIKSVLMLARVTGWTIYCANVCALDADRNPPYLRIARILAEEFEHGAKMAAHQTAKRARAPG